MLLLLFLETSVVVGRVDSVAPLYQQERQATQANVIDRHIQAVLERHALQAAQPCSDEVFFRRVHLDVVGTIPEGPKVRKFLQDRDPLKRSRVIDELLAGEEFADYWSLKWCDLLRVKAEYPIKLWPNAVQAYHRWIHEALKTNMPYDRFAHELLISSGSNFRVPQVNFYRAVQSKEPSGLAAAVVLTFMGSRIEKWPQDKREGMEAFFSRVAYKGTAEWKEEIVYLDPMKTEPIQAMFPTGKVLTIHSGQDPREVFANWLISPENGWFARNIVNRIWSWLMGRGIIHEPDDIWPDNRPSHPALLDYLEKELVQSGYDLKHIYRLILNSQTYQQSPIPRQPHADAEKLFACYPVRQLDAEVLLDVICTVTGTTEGYQSPIPEPFTFVPEYHPSVMLADGSMTSPFLEMFGRPPRDTGLESERLNQPTDAQRLHMLNSSHIQDKIEKSPKLKGLIRFAKRNDRMLIDMIYVNILCRPPMPSEVDIALRYFHADGVKRLQAIHDLVWALMNSKEFLTRH